MWWYGGVSRGCFIMAFNRCKVGGHPLTTDCRYNLTFRQAGKKE